MLHKSVLCKGIPFFFAMTIVVASGCSPSNSGSMDGEMHLTGKAAKLVAADKDPGDPRLAQLVFPTIPANYLTQIVDVGYPYTLAVRAGKCSQQEFVNSLLARALVGFTFYAARSSRHFSKAKGVATGFYESYVKPVTDNHGNTKNLLVVHRILLTMISRKNLKTVNPDFAQGGVVSHARLFSNPTCAMGEDGDFPEYPNEWGGFVGYTKAQLAPFLKVFHANGGKIYWNKAGLVFVSLG